MAGSAFVRPSRRPLRGFLRMTIFFMRPNNSSRPEKHRRRASKDTMINLPHALAVLWPE